MSYMSRLYQDLREHFINHPDDLVEGKKIQLEVDTYKGRKAIDFFITKEFVANFS